MCLCRSVRRWLENNHAGESMICYCLAVAVLKCGEKCGEYRWLKHDQIKINM